MSEASTQITLIGIKLATIGMEFTFNGTTPARKDVGIFNAEIQGQRKKRYL